MKFYIAIIIFLISNIRIFGHPILQNNITVQIKDNHEYEISTDVNLAFLLSQDLISDFNKFDQEFKRLIALSNDDFKKEAFARKNEILAKYVFGFNDKKSVESNLEIDVSHRVQQLLISNSKLDDLTHSNELNVTIKLTGKINPVDATFLYWENVDMVKIDMLKMVKGNANDLGVVWVKPFEVKKISLSNLPVKAIDIILEYIKQGFLHILPLGLDHILFMLCLFLLFKNWKTLLLQISVFTIAHSITLILVTLQLISLKSSVVEPLIALSICVVGLENLYSEKINKYRILLIFLFGLLHGMGFADALSKLGLPENKLLISLISFNVGVELGQIAVVTIAYFTIGFWFYKKEWYRQRITIPFSIVISLYAFYLFVTRLPIF